jgi:hypothetical protein
VETGKAGEVLPAAAAVADVYIYLLYEYSIYTDRLMAVGKCYTTTVPDSREL